MCSDFFSATWIRASPPVPQCEGAVTDQGTFLSPGRKRLFLSKSVTGSHPEKGSLQCGHFRHKCLSPPPPAPPPGTEATGGCKGPWVCREELGLGAAGGLALPWLLAVALG